MKLTENTLVAGRFRLERELGRGGMGSVWRAHHVQLEIPCALKFIEDGAMLSGEMRGRFAREARAAAQLRSTHVVQILDHGEWEGLPYIAMELLEGEDLRARLDRQGRLPPPQVAALVGQVARALTRAHALGIVHRDLKPENIFLVPEDDREVVKILDFGIAKINRNTLHGEGGASSTKTGSLLGTPYYMSPEQARGIRELDHRSDLWSLSVIAFECLTGLRPYESEALGDLVIRIVTQDPPVPTKMSPLATAEFDDWWARAAARAIEHRFSTARELSDALSRALGAPVIPLDSALYPLPSEAPSAISVREPSLRPASPLAATLSAGAAEQAHAVTANTVAARRLANASLLPRIGGGALLIAALVAALLVRQTLAPHGARVAIEGASSAAPEPGAIRPDPLPEPTRLLAPAAPVLSAPSAQPEPAAPLPPVTSAPQAAPQRTGRPPRVEPSGKPKPRDLGF